MVTKISRDELKDKLDHGAPIYLVEALGPKYYNDAHLPTAMNLPLDRLTELAPQILPNRATEVVVYCSNLACANSETAATQLVALGYSNVRKYAEGKQDWVAAGLPIERG